MSERKSNFELLRIISMLFIISFHYVYKSNFYFENLNYNSFIVKSFYFFGELGVNLFILITGYFMIKSKFSYKKLILLITCVNFYYLISVILGYFLEINYFDYNLKNILLSFFPCLFNRYWFITSYIIIYILSPYINKFIYSLSKNQYRKFLVIILLIWCFIPTFFGLLYNSSEKMLYYSRFIWLLIMYFVGSYIRLYSLNFYKKKKYIILVGLISYVVMISSIVFISIYSNIFKKIGTVEVAYLWSPNNIFMFLLSISIFGYFINLNIKNSKIINTLASTTLGIYMIHDGLLNRYIWDRLNTFNKLNSNFSILYIIFDTIIIFLVCSIIEYVRKKVEKKILVPVIDSINDKRINKFINKLLKKI